LGKLYLLGGLVFQLQGELLGHGILLVLVLLFKCEFVSQECFHGGRDLGLFGLHRLHIVFNLEFEE